MTTTIKPKRLPEGKALEAGYKLRQLRGDRSQADVVKLSNGALTFQQVSRIETGKIDKPPMGDLVAYGRVLGLDPTEVAIIYGYWQPEDGQKPDDDPRLVEVRRLLRVLPESPRRRRLLSNLEFAINETKLEEGTA